MNYSLYLFGINNGTFIQYPMDGESTLLQSLCTNTNGIQLVIHRKASLVYHIYLRQLGIDSSQLFGMGLVTNGVYIRDIKTLYQTFDKIFSQIVFNGKILRLTGTGKISFLQDNFAINKAVVEQTETLVRGIVDKELTPCSVQLRQNFSGMIGSKSIAVEERNSEILKLCEQYNVVRIYSKENASSSINYVEQTISNLYKENAKLKSDYNTLLAQKKQYRNVVFLMLGILACSIGLFFLNGSLNEVKGKLSDANKTIKAQTSSIALLNSRVDSVSHELDDTKLRLRSTRQERDSAQARLNRFKNQVEETMPILISKIEIGNVFVNGNIETDYGNRIHSSRTMFLKPRITYKGVKTSENINLYVRLYTPSGLSTGNSSPRGYSYSSSIYVYSGENSDYLIGWGRDKVGHWDAGNYRIEIWYGDVCLKSQSFTIY